MRYRVLLVPRLAAFDVALPASLEPVGAREYRSPDGENMALDLGSACTTQVAWARSRVRVKCTGREWSVSGVCCAFVLQLFYFFSNGGLLETWVVFFERGYTRPRTA